MTDFARMKRSDHSMLPPSPSATIRFQSPNACNLCHQDKDATWADQQVREWRERDYQAPYIQRGELIDAARKRDWTRLPEMLAYIQDKDRDEVFSASLIRLLRACPNRSIWPVIREAAKDPSPLVRSSAVESLRRVSSKKNIRIVLDAAGDDVRLVRIKAATALAGYPRLRMKGHYRKNVNQATEEFISSMRTHPDQWTSHYNLGNYYLNKGDLTAALASYNTSLKLEPRSVMSMVNAALACAQAGNNDQAEAYLKRALDVSPDDAAVNFNMGLLKAEQKEPAEAERHLRTAFKTDPKMHEAAFNLGILAAGDRPDESIEMLQKAYELNKNAKYGYTLAFYLNQNNDTNRAVPLLDSIIQHWPTKADAYLLLADIYVSKGKKDDAVELLQKAMSVKRMARLDYHRLTQKLKRLEGAQ
jgi:tetratricopeptide (TPR) repeat protein